MDVRSPSFQAQLAAARAELDASPPPPLPPRAVDVITRVLAPAMRRTP